MPAIDPDELAFLRLFEMTPDLVCVADRNGYFKQVNQAVIDNTGYTKEELFSRPIGFFIHPDDKEETGRRRKNLLDGKNLVDFENRYITKNGKVIWLHWTSIYVASKEVVFAIAKNITARKKKEQESEEKFAMYKNLAGHFKTKLEKDKRNLATELHEDLAQLASVAKLDINWLDGHLDSIDNEAKIKLHHASQVLDVLINSIRRISYSISPTMLDDVGLNETLKWACDEFTILNNIPCEFESDYDDSNLSHEFQLDLFRIFQEALTNIMYHAEASSVQVSLQPVDGMLCLSIADDGKGFELDKMKDTPGLNIIKIRAASVNGELSIKTIPGKGTTVIVRIKQ